jgi:hypothetical protein
MLVVVPLHAHFRPEHLRVVIATMLRRGPPILRGYFDGETGAWFMLEGTHRLRAAKAIGIVPVLVSIPWWRSRQALVNARFARSRAHVWPEIDAHGFARSADWARTDD